MKYLLILIVLYGSSISKGRYIRNSELLPVNSQNFQRRELAENYFVDYLPENRNYFNHYRQSRAISDESNEIRRQAEERERLLHPHKYWYWNHLRRHQRIQMHRPFLRKIYHSPNLQDYGSPAPLEISDILVRTPSQKNDQIRNDVITEAIDSPLTVHSHRRSAQKSLLGNIKDSTKSFQILNNSAVIKQSSNLEKMANEDPPFKVKRSDDMAFSKLYPVLGKFNLLFCIALFLLFVPLAVVVVCITPTVLFCWNCFTKHKRGNGQPDPKVVAVETALPEETPEYPGPDIHNTSYENMQKNFLTNEMNGEGDTVSKRMKLERWMTQGLPSQHNPSDTSQRRKTNNTAHMEHVEEVPSSDIESLSNTEMSDTESEDSRYAENVPEHSDRREKELKIKGFKATKQESRPFNFPDKVYTISRIHNPKHMKPRNIHTLLDRPRRNPPRTSFSMVDMSTQRFSRL